MLNNLENKVIFAVGLLVAFYLNTAGATESNQMVPPKKPTVIEQKIDSAKLWAIGFGSEVKKQQIENMKTTREALKRDWSWTEGGRFTYGIKNAWEDAKYSFRGDSKTVKGYWQTLADAIASKMKAVEK